MTVRHTKLYKILQNYIYIYMRDMDKLIFICTQLYIQMCMHYVKKIRLVALISPWQIMHCEKACEQ